MKAKNPTEMWFVLFALTVAMLLAWLLLGCTLNEPSRNYNYSNPWWQTPEDLNKEKEVK